MFASTIAAPSSPLAIDVCLTPAPPASPIPVPYPNMAPFATVNPVTAKVLVTGSPAICQGSQTPMTVGDQAGLNGGIASGTVGGPGQFPVGSGCVQFEGKAPVRMGDPTEHNNRNAFSAVLTPSQLVVMVMR